MDFDLRTLAVVLSITQVLQMLVFFAQYRLIKAYRGIGCWAIGFMLLAVGFGFQFPTGLAVSGLPLTIGINLVLVLGTLALYVGTVRFLGRQENRRAAWALVISFILSVFYFTYGDNNPVARIVVGSAVVAALSFLTAAHLFMHPPRTITASAYFNALIFLGHGVFFLIRLATSLANPTASAQTPIQPNVYLVSLIEGILLTFGLIGMVNQRLSNEHRDAKEKLEAIIAASPDGIRITDLNGRVTFVSPRTLQLLGLSSADEILGQSALAWVAPEDRARAAQDLANVLKGIFTKQNQYRLCKKDGALIWGETNAAILTDAFGKPSGIITITRDVTERKQLQEELHRQATTDELTCIANRRHFLQLAQDELARALRHPHAFAIVLLDVDRLKQINDTHGHATGDQALLAFTRLCNQNLRIIDVFARLGGDEFALLLPETNCEQAYHAVERIRIAVTTHALDLGGRSVSVSFSAGVACSTGAPDSCDTLLARADRALYRAKLAGRNHVAVASESVDE